MADFTRPTPTDPEDVARWEETQRRRRMLSGRWRADLEKQLTQSLGIQRAEAIGKVDTSSNAFASACTSLAVLYDVEPEITCELGADFAARMTGILRDAGWASLMQDFQRQTLGLREMVMRVNAVMLPEDLVRIVLRPVSPDCVVATPDPETPYRMATYHEVRQQDAAGRLTWTWDMIDPGAKSFVVVDRDGNDRTKDVHGVTYQGEDYPWMSQTGVAIIPAVLYHAQAGAVLWDAYTWGELVDGTLELGVDRSAYHHSLRQAAYAQRYMVDADIPSDESSTGRSFVAADPSVVLRLERSEPSVQPTIGQWSPPFDPSVMQAAVSEDERRLISSAGIPEADVLRSSSDPRSGVALVQDRESRKQAARRYEQVFRRGDLELLRVIAIAANSARRSKGLENILPESGWGINYRALPPTESELTQAEQRVLAQLRDGLISRAEARAQLKGETIEVARAAIAAIDAERAAASNQEITP